MSGGKKLYERIEGLVSTAAEPEERRLRKVQFTLFSIFVIPAGVIWAILYYVYGEPQVAIIPFLYAALTLIDLVIFIWLRNYTLYRRAQQVFILLLPVLLHLALGGFVGSSAVIVWSFLAVLTAALFGQGREPLFWFCIYTGDIVLVAILQPSVTIQNHLPHSLLNILFALNIVTVSIISFFVLASFVKDRRRLRELEVAYLNQELMLRQSEKLATLGTLAAGVAHELNNPAAATRRASEQLRDAFTQLESAHAALHSADLDEAQRGIMNRISEEMQHRILLHTELPVALRSDAEIGIEDWLADLDIEDGWNLAPALVDAGYTASNLPEVAASFGREKASAFIRWIAAAYPVYSLLYEIGEGSSRISEIVKALRNYSYLDQAPVQNVNINEGIDNTLVILRNKLNGLVTVKKEYATDLPLLTAYGSELNQVWTNILDNAIYALHGTGEITIRTKRDGSCVAVEIEDSGPGIPQEIQSRVFDPFFTTKAPGQGTGLGLSTTYGIVTEKHKGTIHLNSKPGCTIFIVKLPIEIK